MATRPGLCHFGLRTHRGGYEQRFLFEHQLFSVALGIAAIWVLLSMMISLLASLAEPMSSPPIIPIPSCHRGPPNYANAGRPVYWADYPKLIDLQARTSVQLLGESVSYEEFVLEAKKAERLGNSLGILLGMSELDRKNEIAGRLSKLVGGWAKRALPRRENPGCSRFVCIVPFHRFHKTF